MRTPLTDQLRAYFDDVDRQQGAVDLDALRRSAEERVIMIELSPDKAVPPPNGRSSGRGRPILIATAAAVIVAIALVAIRDDDAKPADQPPPTVTVPPTTPPRPLPLTQRDLAPGTYFVDEVAGAPTPRISATLGPWWANVNGPGWNLSKRYATARDFRELTMDEIHEREIGTMAFHRPGAVFADACHPSDGYLPGPVTTLDGFVAALSEQQGWAEVTAPSDISIDGYAGKAFQRTVPADLSDCDTKSYSPRVRTGSSTYPWFLSWEGQGPYEPGQIETLWILDLDGTIVVISTTPWPEPSAGAPADFAADVLDSIRIERP